LAIGNGMIVLWVLIGIFLGTLYTASIRFEIAQVSKQNKKLEQRNPFFSILRILICSAILVLAFRADMKLGFTCLAAFLLSKYVALVIIIKKQPKGE